MAHHGESISEAIYSVLQWSEEGWGAHGDPPAEVAIENVGEGWPHEYVDRDGSLPALFIVKDRGWPAIEHYPKFIVEKYAFSVYAVDTLPTSGYPETEIRRLLHNVVTNILASKDLEDEDLAFTYPMDLSYIEDIKWMGTEVRDEVQELLDSMGLELISARADFEIQAKGTER